MAKKLVDGCAMYQFATYFQHVTVWVLGKSHIIYLYCLRMRMNIVGGVGIRSAVAYGCLR